MEPTNRCLKKILIFPLLFITCLCRLYSNNPCDTCKQDIAGGYMGILPVVKKYFVGLSFQSGVIAGNSGSHSHGEGTSKIYLHTWSVLGKISPHKRINIYIGMPVHYLVQEDQDLKREATGPGDIWTVIQYQVINPIKFNNKKIKHSLVMGGGIKLPTGRYNLYDSLGFYDRYMQPGTGSWDFLLSSQYTLFGGTWGLNTEVNARISTENPDHYLYGHKINAGFKGFYYGKGNKISALVAGGLLYDFATRDIYLRQSFPNTGGHLLNAIASVDLFMKKWTIGSEFRLPMYSYLGNGEVKSGAQILARLMVMF